MSADKFIPVVVAITACGLTASAADITVKSRRFEFGQTSAIVDAIHVTPEIIYNKLTGYGFDLDSTVTADGSGCTSDKPFFFSVALPEGNYNVTVSFGNPLSDSITTVKSEAHRLMLENIAVTAGKTETRTFTVNIRTPQISTGGKVRLKPAEIDALRWDEKLTLEFNGHHPCVHSIEITPADDAITVFLVGDSTVNDQPGEPWNSWGQMLPRFFKPGLAIANHSESGESLGSFLSEKRLDKILTIIKKGDYLIIQIGHNDQKDTNPGAGPFTTYKTRLELFIREARTHGAFPVLVTSMHRRKFDADGKVVNTLGDFPQAVRVTAREQNVPLIDLNNMSEQFYNALGPDRSKLAFQDNTHHNAYGSYELAKCIVEGIRQNNLPIATYIVDGLPVFDPFHPDSAETINIPPSPQHSSQKPDGN